MYTSKPMAVSAISKQGTVFWLTGTPCDKNEDPIVTTADDKDLQVVVAYIKLYTGVELKHREAWSLHFARALPKANLIDVWMAANDLSVSTLQSSIATVMLAVISQGDSSEESAKCSLKTHNILA
jgi:hypothetical protein